MEWLKEKCWRALLIVRREFKAGDVCWISDLGPEMQYLQYGAQKNLEYTWWRFPHFRFIGPTMGRISNFKVGMMKLGVLEQWKKSCNCCCCGCCYCFCWISWKGGADPPTSICTDTLCNVRPGSWKKTVCFFTLSIVFSLLIPRIFSWLPSKMISVVAVWILIPKIVFFHSN